MVGIIEVIWVIGVVWIFGVIEKMGVIGIIEIIWVPEGPFEAQKPKPGDGAEETKPGPLCPALTSGTPQPPRDPQQHPGAAMHLSCCLLLLASLVPPVLGSWGVLYPESVQGLSTSCLLIPCTLSYPPTIRATRGIVAIWYKDYEGQKTLVYHSGGENVDDRFSGRASLVGQPSARNCSLMLREVTPEDNGPYRFRFEIIEEDRWSAERDVVLRVSDTMEQPRVTASQEYMEGQTSTLECFSPYFCPDSFSLRWLGHDPQVSTVASEVQLDTNGVGHHLHLTTSFSWKDHSKKLLCELSYNSRKATSEVVLRVRHAPKDTQVSVTPSVQHIQEGDTVSLTCQVGSSYPQVSGYSWYKDGVSLGSQQVLTLRDVGHEDYGQYHCEAQNPVGTGTAPAVTLYIFSAEISVSPAAQVQEGTATTLSCNIPAREGQAFNYTWYKNGVWLGDALTHTLLLPHIAATDAGSYSCEVTTAQGGDRDMSHTVSLSVVYPPRTPTLTLFQETQGGRVAIIHCAVDSHPVATVALYHRGTLLAASGWQVAPGQRVSVTTTPNALRVEIRGVGPRDGGDYHCTATNTYGNASVTKGFVIRATELLVQPSAEVQEGADVTLSCLGAGGLGTLYTWYRNSKWLQDTPTPTLHFPSIHPRDAGAFQCRSSNSSDISIPVPLRVLFPPRPPLMSYFLETQGGRLGIIRCRAESDPEANLTLWRGEAILACTGGCPPAPSPRLQASWSYNSLKVEIQEVVLEDEGTYVCRAENPQGNASSSLDLRAETAGISVVPSSQVLEGQAANLSCWLHSQAPVLPNITWYHNGHQLARGSATTLVFQAVAREDAGLYQCRASTPSTTRSSPTLTLDVLYPPRDPLLTSFLETESGHLAIFQCSVASNPPAQLALHRGEELVATSTMGTGPRVSITAVPNTLRVELREVTPADEGSYSCTATNTHGTAARRLFFRVPAARVLVSPSVEVLEGDDVTLTCQVAIGTQGDTNYTWYRNSRWVRQSSENLLALPHISRTAAGAYQCRAHGLVGTSLSPAVTLGVSYPPSTPELTFFVEPPEGTRGVLQCSVDSSPPAQLALFKDRVLVATTALPQPPAPPRLGVTLATNALRVTVSPVLLEDEGGYLCTAHNPHGNASTAGNFTAGATRLWISPSPDVREGDNVTLTCSVASGAEEVLSYSWYRNGLWLSTTPSPVLTLPRVAASAAASYRCSVRTPARTRSSAPTTLSVLYPPRNLELKTFQESSDGTALILLCSVDSNPPSQLSLLRGGQPVASSPPPGGDHPGGSTRLTPAPNALRLELQEASQEDEGEYECRASSPLGSTHASLPLRVPAVRVVMRPSAEVTEGTEVTLTCRAPGAPPGTLYSWFKDGQWLGGGPDPSLALPATRRTDAGVYGCQVGRGLLRAPPAALRVLYAPQDLSFTSLLDPRGGHRALLLCTVDSDPPSHLSLHRGDGGPPLASSRGSDDPRFSVQATPNTLRVGLGALGGWEGGVYVCRANNSQGSVSETLRLQPPGVTVTVEPSPEVPEGTRATVTCWAVPWVGDEANYTWYRNNRWLQEGPSASLLLTRVSPTDTGSYHCRASGGRGTATSPPLSLTVLCPPSPPPQTPPRDVSVSTFLENRAGRVGILLCRADSHPPATIALYRRGHLLATSLTPARAPGVHASPSHNSLRLELGAVGPGDAGEYICVAGNPLGNATARADFDVSTLTHLRLFTILAGLLMAILCLATLATLAVKLWPRMRKFRGWPGTENTLELRSKQEQTEPPLCPRKPPPEPTPPLTGFHRYAPAWPRGAPQPPAGTPGMGQEKGGEGPRVVPVHPGPVEP
ncbi:LOW QUALITY PROTEIN: sialoadhesin [Phaethornis superciliosus]